MKDFMMLPWGVEVGVMSIWFLCTVCRKVRRGRTTCRRDQSQAPGAGQTDQGQTSGGGTDRPQTDRPESDPGGRTDRPGSDPGGRTDRPGSDPRGRDRQIRVRPQRAGQTDQGQTPGAGQGRRGRTDVHSPCWQDRAGRGSCSWGAAAPHPPAAALRPAHSPPACSCASSCRGMEAAVSGGRPWCPPQRPRHAPEKVPPSEQNWAQPPRLQPERYRRGESP